LERGIVTLLLAAGLGLPALPPSAVAGATLGYLGVKLAKPRKGAAEAPSPAPRKGALPPPLAGILATPAEELAADDRRDATSFVAFLIERLGAERFKAFLARLAEAPPERAAEAAYERPLALLEKQWRERWQE